jgi:hypothetical protein
LSITYNGGCTYPISKTQSVVLQGNMTDNKETMGAVTHQMSAVDDDLRKGGDVQEKVVASVALGKSYTSTLL